MKQAIPAVLLALASTLAPVRPAAAGGGIASNYCQTSPNSVGAGAVMDHAGSLDPAANDFVLLARDVPARIGLFFMGDTQTFVSPFFDGHLCIAMGGGSQHFRLFPPSRVVGNTAMRSVDNTIGPASLLTPGSTWNFQYIYRDPSPAGTGVNLSDGLEVTFASANTAPVADAGPDQAVTVGDLVQLDGSGSSDADMDMLTFDWALVAVPAGSAASLSDPTAVDPTFVADRAGNYVVQLVVNDGTVDSAPDTVTITTQPGNTAPVADAGPDQTVTVLDTVQLDGSGSTDVDMDMLDFAWSFQSRPAGSAATLSDPTAAMPTFVADVAGDFVVRLIVNDGTEDSAPDTVTITTRPGNSPPVASAGPDQTVSAGDTVQLDGSGSTDVDMDMLDFAWSFVSRPAASSATLSDPTAVMPTFVADAPGSYVVQLIVNDGTVDSAPDTVFITTNPVNTAPTADAGPDQTVLVGDTVQLDGTGSSDPEMDPLSYAWSLVSIPAGSTAALSDPSVATPTFVVDLAGNYVVQLVVDDGQLPSAPDTMTVTTGNSRPVADPGPDQTVVAGSLVQLDGSGSSDPDMDPLGFAWSFTSMPPASTATLSDPADSMPTFVADAAGDYVVQLIVDDGSIDSAPATTRVTALDGSLSLALVDTGVVGVGRSAELRVTLSTPAPLGGTSVSLASDDPTVLAVSAPGSVQIPGGVSSGILSVDGQMVGSTTLRASAPGYADGALAVEVTLNLLSLPPTLDVPLGQTVSIPVTIAPDPAPAGGLTVALTSSDPLRVEVLTPTVVIPAGSFGASGMVSGAAPGPADVLAASPTFASDTAVATTSAEVAILENTLSIRDGLPGEITLELQAGGAPVAAPAPGVVVALSASNPGCVDVPATVTIPTGLTSATVPVSYGGSAALPCASTVSADAGPGVTGDSVAVDVDPSPGIQLFGFNTVLGAGLQSSSFSAQLQDGNHGGVTVRIESDDPATLLVAPNPSSAGVTFFDTFLPTGSVSVSFTVQALAGGPGAGQITVSAPGFAAASDTVDVVQPGVQIVGLAASIDTLDPDDDFLVRLGVPLANGATLAVVQAARVGGGPIAATVTNGDAAIGELVTLAATGQSVAVDVPEGQIQSAGSVATGGIAFRSLTPGQTTVSAVIPGFLSTDQASADVTVTGPTMTFFTTSPVAAGLALTSSSLTLSASQHGGVTVRIESSNPGLVRVAPDANTAGTTFIDETLANGQSTATFTVQGIEGTTGMATITATAPGFATTTTTVEVVQAGLVLVGLSGTIDTLDPDDDFLVRVGRPNAQGTNLLVAQPVRVGAGALTATVVSGTPATAELVTSGQSGNSVTVDIAEGQIQSATTVATGGVALRPVAPGTTNVAATIPGFIATTAASADVTVSGPTMSYFGTTPVPAGLARTGASLSLSASQHGGVTVRIESSDPSRVLVAPDANTAGTAFIDEFVPNGTTNVAFAVQAIAGTTGSATLTASATGFADATQVVDVVQPAIQVLALASSIDTLDPDDDFIVRVGQPSAGGTTLAVALPVRVGGGNLTATVTNSNAPVGELVTLGSTGQSVPVTVAEGQIQSASTVAGGGVAFRSLTTGMTTVSAAATGFLSTNDASQVVTVTAPSISLNTGGTVGAGLARTSAFATLSASQHGGVTVRVASTNAGVALVAPDGNTAGTAFFDTVLANGQTNISFTIQGVEGATGSPLIRVTAPGFSDANEVVDVVQPALQILSLAGTTTAGAADDPFLVRTGIPTANGATIAQAQPVRAGAPPLIVTVSSSSATVGRLVTSAASGASVTVNVDPGQFQSASTVALGGVAFDPLAAGSTLVTASAAGYLTTGQGSVSVTVDP